MTFAEYTDKFINTSATFTNIPIMVQECIRVHAHLKRYPEYYQMQTPILRSMSFTKLSLNDIKDGVLFLKQLGFSSFIFAEESTETLEWLEMIMSVSDKFNLPVKCSCSSSYTKIVTGPDFQTKIPIHGVVIKITDRKPALPGNVIQ